MQVCKSGASFFDSPALINTRIENENKKAAIDC